jgi:glycosyltransferase involved in cell wall biosynthesis
MKILFVHNNFPGQFGGLAARLMADGHTVAVIGSDTAKAIPGIALTHYRIKGATGKDVHPFAARYDKECGRGAAAAMAARRMDGEGFVPDVIVGHVGWGETLFLKDVWPAAKLVGFAELYFRSRDSSFDFDPEFHRQGLDRDMNIRARNGAVALALMDSDRIVCPTKWQLATFPKYLRDQMTLLHDGIDTKGARPRPAARVRIKGGPQLQPGDEIITHVNTNLEPARGMHIFLRALPDILAARPNAHVLIVGSDEGTPYVGDPPDGGTWKQKFLGEVGDRLDSTRVHWLGRLRWLDYIGVLAVSKVHVYLTYPFVLSWSILEAMSVGCLVVASATAPVLEVIEHERNGLTVDFFDQAALARTVIDALARPAADFAQLKEAARRTVIERYDRDTICLPRWIELIESLGRA